MKKVFILAAVYLAAVSAYGPPPTNNQILPNTGGSSGCGPGGCGNVGGSSGCVPTGHPGGCGGGSQGSIHQTPICVGGKCVGSPVRGSTHGSSGSGGGSSQPYWWEGSNNPFKECSPGLPGCPSISSGSSSHGGFKTVISESPSSHHPPGCAPGSFGCGPGRPSTGSVPTGPGGSVSHSFVSSDHLPGCAPGSFGCGPGRPSTGSVPTGPGGSVSHSFVSSDHLPGCAPGSFGCGPGRPSTGSVPTGPGGSVSHSFVSSDHLPGCALGSPGCGPGIPPSPSGCKPGDDKCGRYPGDAGTDSVGSGSSKVSSGGSFSGHAINFQSTAGSKPQSRPGGSSIGHSGSSKFQSRPGGSSVGHSGSSKFQSRPGGSSVGHSGSSKFQSPPGGSSVGHSGSSKFQSRPGGSSVGHSGSSKFQSRPGGSGTGHSGSSFSGSAGSGSFSSGSQHGVSSGQSYGGSVPGLPFRQGSVDPHSLRPIATGVSLNGTPMMMMPMGMSLPGGGCSAGSFCVPPNTCNPYNGFIIRNVNMIAAVRKGQPQVPLLECFVPAGGIEDGLCCQEDPTITGGAD